MARIKPQALLLQSKKKKGPTRIGLTTIITCNFVIILIVLSLYGTYKHYKRSNNEVDANLHTLEDVESLGEEKKYDLPNYAIMNTSKGIITIELFKDAAPGVVDKFLDLCQKGYFQGMPFHRVIKNYVIQGGDLRRLGAAEDWTLKGKSNSKLAARAKHEAFMLGTSKAKQDSKEFLLFITTAPIPDLNDNVIVFGRVIKGEDVVQDIEEVDTDELYRPKSAIGIINVVLKGEI